MTSSQLEDQGFGSASSQAQLETFRLAEQVQQALGAGRDALSGDGRGTGILGEGTDESVGAPTASTTMESSRGLPDADPERLDEHLLQRQEWGRSLCTIFYHDQATFENMYHTKAGFYHALIRLLTES